MRGQVAFLAFLALPAFGETTVTVESYSATFGELTLSVAGDVTHVRLDAQGGKLFDWIATGGEGGTPIPTVPGIGSNNDGTSSAFITVRGPFTATVDLDPISSQPYPGIQATVNGVSQALLVGVAAVFSADPIPPPPPPPPPVVTGTAPLSWLPPTTNTDGTPLTNLTGFKVYWGTTEGTYPNSQTLGVVTSYTVENLSPGTWYFVVTALAGGVESGFSNVATKTIAGTTPPPPTDPCVSDPFLTPTNLAWPTSRTGSRTLRWSTPRTVVRVDYQWPVGQNQRATWTDDRGCSVTVQR